MKKIMLILLIVLFVASYANANYIQNGSFESPDISVDGYSGWHVYQDGVGAWLSPSGTGIEIQESNTVVTAQDRDQYVELDSDYKRGGDPSATTTNSKMTQAVYLTIGSYILDFYYQPRVNNDPQNTNQIDYGVEGIFSSFITGASRSGWENVVSVFDIVSADNYNVFFAAGGKVDTLGGFIDNVTLEAAPVPEPATILLLGGGLLGLGWYGRKRKKA